MADQAGITPEMLEQRVRVYVYDVAVATGKVPKPVEIAASLRLDQADVEGAIQRLAQDRVWFLAPGTSHIWAANPFCAIPSNFKVESLGRTYWGVCIWDALWIPSAIHADATITTLCPDCNHQLGLDVRDGKVARQTGVVQFAVPTLQWWQNIAFT